MTCSKECCQEEFRARNFLLGYPDPSRFTRFEWGCPLGYLVWRVIGCVFAVGLLVTSIVLDHLYFNFTTEQRVKWVIFLTNWALVVLMTYSVTDVTTTLYVYFNRQDIVVGRSREMPWYLKMTWVLYNIAMPMAIMVTGLYFIAIYTPGQSFAGPLILPFLSHGTNSIYAVINIFISGIPTRLYHFFHVTIVGVVFAVFTYIYYAAGGTDYDGNRYIYALIDWSDPPRAFAVAVASVFGVFIVHILIFFVFLIRREIFGCSTCCASTRVHDSSREIQPTTYETDKF